LADQSAVLEEVKVKRRVNVYPEGLDPIQGNPGESVLDVLLKSKIEIDHACGGMGSCGTCRIVVTSNVPLSDRNELEAERASELGFEENVRLSCQLECTEGLHFKIL
jgi:2Fe-2S ferredoxin